MAVIGCLGDVVFHVSDATIITLKDWKWSGSARYAVHERHINHALTEFTGLDPDKISFTLQLRAELGVNPLKEMAKLWNYLRKGETVPLTIGTHGYGFYRWNLTSLENEIRYTDKAGNLLGADVSVALQEYLKESHGFTWKYRK